MDSQWFVLFFTTIKYWMSIHYIYYAIEDGENKKSRLLTIILSQNYVIFEFYERDVWLYVVYNDMLLSKITIISNNNTGVT